MITKKGTDDNDRQKIERRLRTIDENNYEILERIYQQIIIKNKFEKEMQR